MTLFRFPEMRCEYCNDEIHGLDSTEQTDPEQQLHRFLVCGECPRPKHSLKRKMPDDYGVFTYWVNAERFMTQEEAEENFRDGASISYCVNSSSWGRRIVTVDSLDEFRQLRGKESPFTASQDQEDLKETKHENLSLRMIQIPH